jgi:predicted glycogen debranching enzyme
MSQRSTPTHTLRFEPQTPHDSPLDREWLLSAGDGSYAMGTVSGIASRRYHGLLVACTKPPVGRIVVVNQVLEQLVIPGDSAKDKDAVTDLSSLGFGDTVAPAGYKFLRAFARGLLIQWEINVEGLRISKELSLGESTRSGSLIYTIERTSEAGPQNVSLRLAPLLTLRDFHQLFTKDQNPLTAKTQSGDLFVSRPDGLTARVSCPGARFNATNEWWYNVHYQTEALRGQDCREDLFLPGWFDTRLLLDRPGLSQRVELKFKLGKEPFAPETPLARPDRIRKIAQLLEPDCANLFTLGSIDKVPADRLATILAIAGDDFIVKRTVAQEQLTTILAGYPWFADWGRDTFIALPGLLLETQRFQEARSTLKVFSKYIQDGLVPNVFDDYNDQAAAYNTVDASLWYVHAACAYVKASGDMEAWKDWLGEACKSIIGAYIQGTKFDIRMAGDGLITAGNPGTQLTWMDAARDGVIFTPRFGKPVEINALWHHCLVSVAALMKDTDRQTASHYDKLVGRIGRTFLRLYWNEEAGCLHDRIYTNDAGEEVPDTLIRPNQIFAGSLENSPLPRTRQIRMLQTVRDKLVTPYGVRTLAPDSPGYQGTYAGNPFQRDSAYHQGTAWPWLLGPYAEAVLRAGRFSPESKREAWSVIRPIVEQVLGGSNWPSLGQVWEVHSGDPDHNPGGCPAQAWSVAELLRLVRLINREA